MIVLIMTLSVWAAPSSSEVEHHMRLMAEDGRLQRQFALWTGYGGSALYTAGAIYNGDHPVRFLYGGMAGLYLGMGLWATFADSEAEDRLVWYLGLSKDKRDAQALSHLRGRSRTLKTFRHIVGTTFLVAGAATVAYFMFKEDKTQTMGTPLGIVTMILGIQRLVRPSPIENHSRILHREGLGQLSLDLYPMPKGEGLMAGIRFAMH